MNRRRKHCSRSPGGTAASSPRPTWSPTRSSPPTSRPSPRPHARSPARRTSSRFRATKKAGSPTARFASRSCRTSGQGHTRGSVGAQPNAAQHSEPVRFAIVLSVVASALALATSGTAGSTPATTLRADVAEWSIVPSTGAVRAGVVRLVVHNRGTAPHQVTVVRTATFGARRRLAGARAVVRPIAASVIVRPGGTATLVVSLKHGSYVLLDNLPWSYWKGTSVAFSVR